MGRRRLASISDDDSHVAPPPRYRAIQSSCQVFSDTAFPVCVSDAQPVATANGPKRPWLISNVGQRKNTRDEEPIDCRRVGAYRVPICRIRLGYEPCRPFVRK